MSEPTTKIPDGKTVDLSLLLAELRAAGAGIDSIGRRGSELIAYDADGQPIAWSADAIAGLEAHTPPPPPIPPDYGGDAPDDYPSRAADAVTRLRAYLGASSPTGAQTVAALKVLIRLVLYLARRSL